MSREILRDAFDDTAAVYHSARPAYPTELFDDLITITEITPPSALLEIGAGPGTATVELARRGYAITALELGPRLAAQARNHLADRPEVEVITTSFEDWAHPQESRFELVYSANAWQWLDPATRWTHAAEMITDGGHLAVFGASHAFPDGFDPFFTQMQAVYEQLGDRSSEPADWPPPPPRLTNDWLIDEAVASGRFRPVDRRLYVWALRYDADHYIDLLNSFSNHVVREPADRALLEAEVRRRLAARPDGRVTRHWVSQMAVLQRIQD